MSDAGRLSSTDKAAAAAKPDSQKTFLEQAKDTIVGKTDDAAANSQPESEKSTTQSISDKLTGN